MLFKSNLLEFRLEAVKKKLIITWRYICDAFLSVPFQPERENYERRSLRDYKSSVMTSKRNVITGKKKHTHSVNIFLCKDVKPFQIFYVNLPPSDSCGPVSFIYKQSKTLRARP